MTSRSFAESCVPNTPKSDLDPDNRYETPETLETLLICPHHHKRLERIARKHTRGTAIAWEDAVQAAQIKILEAVRAGKFRHGGAQEFYRWSTTVARFEIIDLVRREKRHPKTSLDQPIIGTDLPLSETIAAEFNLLDSVERSDLVLKALEAIHQLELCHPDRQYLKLWQGMVQGKKQMQLALDLGVSQGAISKRWKELVQRIAEELGLLQVEAVRQEVQHWAEQKRVGRPDRQNRKRSTTTW
jgi:RNA polymerase sigma factor (sigma-70 family)